MVQVQKKTFSSEAHPPILTLGSPAFDGPSIPPVDHSPRDTSTGQVINHQGLLAVKPCHHPQRTPGGGAPPDFRIRTPWGMLVTSRRDTYVRGL